MIKCRQQRFLSIVIKLQKEMCNIWICDSCISYNKLVVQSTGIFQTSTVVCYSLKTR